MNPTRQAFFKYTLDDDEVNNIKKFCDSAPYCSIEQYLGWPQVFTNTKFCYFYLVDETGIRCYCQIIERYRFAQINFGPVCSDKVIMVDAIKDIISYYKKKYFIFLGIQLYFKSGYETDYIEYNLNKFHKINYCFNNFNTKSSIEINLDNEFDTIFRNFSKGHRSAIKKAQKLGITVENLTNTSDLVFFKDIYSKMCRSRKIDDRELGSNAIFEIYDLLKTMNKGKILIARDNTQRIIGGIILVSQGISLRYFKGAADTDLRNLPITHLLLFEAIKHAKMDGYKYFDFWGINHFAEIQDPIYNVNHFKKGFGGYYTFFAKKMNISLIPFGSLFYRLSLKLKKFLFKLHMLKK